MTTHRIIHLHAEAPPKPEVGAPCNGCGVCCAYSLCPVGLLLHRRRHGPCPSLQWDEGARRYRCGPASGSGLLGGLARRWISAGSGCDCSLECAPHQAIPRSSRSNTDSIDISSVGADFTSAKR